MHFSRVLAAAFCMAASSCAHSEFVEPPQHSEHFISLTYGACFGACVPANVTVFFDGLRIYRSSGTPPRFAHEGETPEPAKLLIEDGIFGSGSIVPQLELYNALVAAGLEKFEGDYAMGSPGAQCRTDSSHLVMEVAWRSNRRRIHWNTGCEGFEGHEELVHFFDDAVRILEIEDLQRRAAPRPESGSTLFPRN
ncbi:MAG: hypothetical protein FP825_16340 [Hyphomonas sp.]|uniref:hypothetical protein n=1 Tax=Hyphomonas sp. TaxID=87 RepID=UPI0017D15A56|nr:hypothetical protein [Hyphomonas sp.]MBU3919868.1 hypothetical protein [Alphaproteobacteria bacterium]MBA3070040.1 hypothetical protein [Hyphomonas sp.]MBU4060384.1 hypothetical protein [Alphaproteobacteria bacterium]MBU4163052.1 hypothetical protein [Alphaproteobacteria bacterium]MBU4567845.1 hypothetical protein [Alphaproteobacteria bacterium]